jgi:uncharacterized membrane protein
LLLLLLKQLLNLRIHLAKHLLRLGSISLVRLVAQLARRIQSKLLLIDASICLILSKQISKLLLIEFASLGLGLGPTVDGSQQLILLLLLVLLLRLELFLGVQ